MGRPFLRQGARLRLFRRRAGEPFANGFELRVQRLNFLTLAKNHIAEFEHGLLQVGYFGLEPLQRVFRKQRQRFTP